MQLVQGLTQQEVRARQQRGESNAASFRSSRSYWDIIRTNLFNFFNNILFAIGIALIALGQYNNAFTSVGQGLVNALIGTIQEINAKRKLDKIALLTRTKVRVLSCDVMPAATQRIASDRIGNMPAFSAWRRMSVSFPLL